MLTLWTPGPRCTDSSSSRRGRGKMRPGFGARGVSSQRGNGDTLSAHASGSHHRCPHAASSHFTKSFGRSLASELDRQRRGWRVGSKGAREGEREKWGSTFAMACSSRKIVKPLHTNLRVLRPGLPGVRRLCSTSKRLVSRHHEFAWPHVVTHRATLRPQVPTRRKDDSAV